MPMVGKYGEFGKLLPGELLCLKENSVILYIKTHNKLWEHWPAFQDFFTFFPALLMPFIHGYFIPVTQLSISVS